MTKQSISAADAKRKAPSQLALSTRSDPTVPPSERRRKIPDAAATAEAKPAQAGAATPQRSKIRDVLRERQLAREEADKNLAERSEKPLKSTNDQSSTSRSQGRSAELLEESQRYTLSMCLRRRQVQKKSMAATPAPMMTVTMQRPVHRQAIVRNRHSRIVSGSPSQT